MRHRRISFGLFLVLGALASASACSNQSEGQRCDKNSGDADCDSGLVCTSLRQSTTGGQFTPAVCCPPQGQAATTDACRSLTATFDAGTGPADSGSPAAGGASGTDGGTAGTTSSGGASTGGSADTGGSAGTGGSADTGGSAGTGMRDASDSSVEGGK